MKDLRYTMAWLLLAALTVAIGSPTASGQEELVVDGKLIANGEAVELPYVYVIAQEEGFYDESDPTWTVIFAAESIEVRELDSFFFDFPYVKVGVTLTSEFNDSGEREIQALSQDLKLTADGSNISGGDYPEVVLESSTVERFAGRIFHTESKTFFEDTYKYDFSFSVPISDPNAPIGPALPEGGGEPGKTYVAWTKAVLSGDVEKMKALVPPEMAEMLGAEGMDENITFMKEMTPREVKVLGGSSDGTTAILKVEGLMDGQPIRGEITMTLQGDIWLTTAESW
ncbi:MAG: hypothetical protein K0U98_01285 [Deltaproteobacteria bacterium]|nr:hypothetical protein [Deltaproteobacteria bacterium]